MKQGLFLIESLTEKRTFIVMLIWSKTKFKTAIGNMRIIFQRVCILKSLFLKLGKSWRKNGPTLVVEKKKKNVT